MRKNELDWLRVILFGLLILYHVGMFFVPWGWHIKNNELYPWLRYPMMFLNQWRLPLLFIISGMGTYFALGKRTAGQFAGERFTRLMIPLLFGMLVIITPQVYFERVAHGQFTGGYFDFYPSQVFTHGAYPEGNFSWHHLWFLPYLFLFSVVWLPVFLSLRRHPHNFFTQRIATWATTPWGLFWLVVPLYVWEALVEPFFESTHALVGDWFNIVNYGTLFFYGFVLISIGEPFWNTVRTHRQKYLLGGLLAFTLLIGIRELFEDTIVVHFTEAVFKVVNLWCWILALFGYASTYLVQRSPFLIYANEAVYPFYILHQTVTITIAFYLMELPWGLAAKFLVLTVGTFGVCLVGYELLIRRWKVMRVLFGMKEKLKVES
ncbi:MAG: acyltransferase family protein [Cyclobacteriaceae bacterium]|nr:acyltransferase family protein [Cyclobacteriaceae bacterium]